MGRMIWWLELRFPCVIRCWGLLRSWRRILRIIEWDDPAVFALHTTAAFHIARSDLTWTPANSEWPMMQLATARR